MNGEITFYAAKSWAACNQSSINHPISKPESEPMFRVSMITIHDEEIIIFHKNKNNLRPKTRDIEFIRFHVSNHNGDACWYVSPQNAVASSLSYDLRYAMRPCQLYPPNHIASFFIIFSWFHSLFPSKIKRILCELSACCTHLLIPSSILVWQSVLPAIYRYAINNFLIQFLSFISSTSQFFPLINPQQFISVCGNL